MSSALSPTPEQPVTLASGAKLWRFTLNKGLAQSEADAIQRVANLYTGDNITDVAMLPNMWMQEGDSFPRGTAVRFSNKSPMFTDPFHADSFMTGGSALFKVDSSSVRQPEGYYAEASRQMVRKMLDALPTDSEDAPSLRKRDAETNMDLPSTNFRPVMSNGSGFSVEFCVGNSVRDNERVTEHYLLVTGSVPRVSQELLQMVSARQTIRSAGVGSQLGHRTQSTNLKIREFMEWPETNYAVEVGKRNRAVAAAMVAETLGLSIPLRSDLFAGAGAGARPGPLMGIPFIETRTYFIDSVNDEFVYYADATRTDTVRGGIIMKLAPTVGAALLFGETCSSNGMGGGWTNVSGVNAFPTSTGRTRSISDAYNMATRTRYRFEPATAMTVTKSAVTIPTVSFGWHGSLQHNDQFDPTSHRCRDKQFIALEQQLGRDPALGGVDLKPIIQVVSATAPHKVASMLRR